MTDSMAAKGEVEEPVSIILDWKREDKCVMTGAKCEKSEKHLFMRFRGDYLIISKL